MWRCDCMSVSVSRSEWMYMSFGMSFNIICFYALKLCCHAKKKHWSDPRRRRRRQTTDEVKEMKERRKRERAKTCSTASKWATCPMYYMCCVYINTYAVYSLYIDNTDDQLCMCSLCVQDFWNIGCIAHEITTLR